MKIAFACDHAGFEFRAPIFEHLKTLGHEVIDLGPQSIEPLDDFPDYSRLVCEDILAGNTDRGVLVCGTGIGMSIAANRFPGIRAVLAYAPEVAKMSRSHNDANVICFGARTMKIAEVLESFNVFLSEPFLEGKYQVRNEKIDQK